jgi:hypothetical protein
VVGVPDGANAGRHRAVEDTEEPEVTGGSTDSGDAEQDPGSPAEQVNGEITAAEVSEWWKSLFGFGGGQPYEAGGGGSGGQFMFANLEELDGVITRWEEERDGILADRDAIADAYYMIAEPAGDMMSRGQTSASRDSLATMYYHSDAMFKYAEGYLEKLYASRQQMALMEEGAHTRMRSVRA